MKQFFILFAFLLVGLSGFSQADELDILTTDGQSMKLSEYLDQDKNHLVIFWASWCSICRNEKNRLSDYYESWTQEYNTEVVSISTDVASARPNAEALFESNDWPYQLVFSTAADAASAFGASGVPYTFLLNADQEIIYSKRSFRSGDEVTIDEEIRNAFETSSNTELGLNDLSFEVYRQNNGVEIVFDQVLNTEANLNVFSLDGKQLGSKELSLGSETYNVEFPVNANSVMVVELQTKEGRSISKIVGL